MAPTPTTVRKKSRRGASGPSPADAEPRGTRYLPPALQAWLSVDFEDGASTGFAMGAISAAFFVPGDP